MVISVMHNANFVCRSVDNAVCWSAGNIVCCSAGNVYDMLPDSPVRSVSIVLMIIHQCIAFGMFVMPVHHMWEKLIRTHDKPYWIRLPSRLPVGE